MYKAVRNLKWVNAEHTQIDCEVNFDHVGFEEWSPFTADPTDEFAPYCKEIFDKAVAGEFGEVAEYVAFIEPVIAPTTEPTAEENKAIALVKLEKSAWSEEAAIADPQISSPCLMNQNEFIAYRNLLRIFVANPREGFISFPIKPKEVWSI